MNRAAIAFHLLRNMGPKWAANRATNAAKRKIGHFERAFPQGSWNSVPLERFLADKSLSKPKSYFKYRGEASPRFFFSQTVRIEFGKVLASLPGDENRLREEVDAIGRGEFRYFEFHKIQAGFPPDWHRNPFSNREVPSDLHWSRISDFEWGDIKGVWELNRFSFVFKMMRAYWRWGDEQVAESFWRLIEDWRSQNPPNTGANWKCGQETAFRIMAWCFGLYGFWNAPSTTPQRVSALAQMIAVSAERIARHIGYALSQRNNHGISEALGLWTVGTLFPEFKQSERWERIGRELLEQLGRELIYDDGSFVQHSLNYHRLMLHDYLWVLRLGDLNGRPFSDELKQRFERAVDFLFQVTDEGTGKGPYFGQNDGALVLPLSSCDYQDLRPVLQAGQYYCHGTRCFESGPWDEDLVWLFGPSALNSSESTGEKAPSNRRQPRQQSSSRPSLPSVKASTVRDDRQRTDFAAPIGGYYTLRSREGFAFIRCPKFKDRPAQADALHVDIWWKGHNVATDAGTYSYNAPEPWNDPLSQTIYHNTVTVDGRDQMERVSRFIWLPWLKARERAFRTDSSAGTDLPEFNGPDGLAYWEGEHDGYERGKVSASHRRAIVRLGENGWIVLDRLCSARPHAYRLHWLLAHVPHTWIDGSCLKLEFDDSPYYLRVGTASAEQQSSLVIGDPNSPRGWRAPYYFHREPAMSLELVATAQHVWFWTVFSEDRTQVKQGDRVLSVVGRNWDAILRLAGRDNEPMLVTSVSLNNTGNSGGKFEIRNPKSETNSKSEFLNPKP